MGPKLRKVYYNFTSVHQAIHVAGGRKVTDEDGKRNPHLASALGESNFLTRGVSVANDGGREVYSVFDLGRSRPGVKSGKMENQPGPEM